MQCVIDPVLREMTAIFADKRRQLCLVGGAVRDMLRGNRARDWDLATDALPTEVIAMFSGGGKGSFVIPTGIKHGTVTVHYRGRAFEVTTFRSESGYSDKRRPDSVVFGTSIEADLSRRDFTMNAAAYRLPAGPLIDPFGGAQDVRARLIRCVGRPEERFAEDGLRPMRALRFASQLGFTLDAAVLAAIPGAIPCTTRVAPERLRDEIEKIIASPDPAIGLRLMEQTGLLRLLLPELAACRGVEQKGFHRFDVLDHSLLACGFAARKGYSQEVRTAALLHDIGKPLCARKDSGGIWTFYNHEKESERLARNILLRFRWPNAFIETVCHLVSEHMFHYDDSWTAAAVRRFIIRVGEESLRPLWHLRRADAYGMTGQPPPADFLLPLQERVEKALAAKNALSLKDLALNGRDLLALGVPAGKRVGVILRELLAAVVEDPSLNTRDGLLDLAGRMRGDYRPPS
ncbi:MAG: CCA tRNA nucleotidyltransferase [Treponema sp.]|jgi:tRNA nucleotidyltransferase/poly(A) polymerase|nr:CCA tRNA nucleotidyltransferase [Treponema sp.]